MSKIVFTAATVQGGRFEGVEARLYEEQIGDFPLGCDRRHCRTHAEFPRFVACGRDDAAFARAADRDRLAAQLRIVMRCSTDA